MQRANTTLKLTVLAVLLAHGAFAAAQATLPPIPAASVALAAPSVPDSKTISGPIGAAAKALVIGKSDDAPAASGSLKEMENLQREVFLGELRAKLRTQALAGKTEVASTSGAQTSAVPVPAVPPAAQVNLLPQFMPSAFAPPAMAPTAFPVFQQPAFPGPDEPTAQLVSVIVSALRTRADVHEDGVVKTVKEGDKLGAWSVTSITTNGVMVERTITRVSMNRPAFMPVAIQTKGKSLPVPKRVVFQPDPAPFEQTLSVLLKPYHPPVIVAVPTASGGIATPVVPPLPASMMRADSTSISPPAQIVAK